MFSRKTNQLLEKIITLMSAQNSVISQLASDFAKFQTDFSAFTGAVKAFIASATSGSGGTVLSAADQATLSGIDTAVDALDSSLGAITIPNPIPAGNNPTP